MKWLIPFMLVLAGCGDESDVDLDASSGVSNDGAGIEMNLHDEDGQTSPVAVSFSVVSGDGSCIEYDANYNSFRASLAKGAIISEVGCSVAKASGRCTIVDSKMGSSSVVYYAKESSDGAQAQSCKALGADGITATYLKY